MPAHWKCSIKASYHYLLCIILPFNHRFLTGKTLHVCIFIFSIVQCMVLSRCSVNFNEAGKILCPPRIDIRPKCNEYQGWNSTLFTSSCAVFPSFHCNVLQHHLCYWDCNQVTRGVLPAGSKHFPRSHLTAGCFVSLESLFSFYAACSTLYGFFN